MRIIAGKFRGRLLTSSSLKFIRPTSDRIRENLFNILEHMNRRNFEEARVLDLFAGTGALGIEALSRGAKTALFIEKSIEGCNQLQNNITVLNLGKAARILRCDATRLGKPDKKTPFDFVFADPPYGKGLGEKAFFSALFHGWLHKNTLLVLEESAKSDNVLPLPFILKDKRSYAATNLYIYTIRGEKIWRKPFAEASVEM